MNTRRSGTSVGNIGQRRPPQAQQPQNMANNFVPGGQMKPQQQPVIRMPTNPQPQGGPQKPQQQTAGGPQKSEQWRPYSNTPTNLHTQKPGTDTKLPVGVAASPAKPATAPAHSAIKQEPVTPNKPQAAAAQQQQPKPAAQQAPVRPQQPQPGPLQMQKLTPQQQQAIKQQQALKQQQTIQTKIPISGFTAAATVTVPPAPKISEQQQPSVNAPVAAEKAPLQKMEDVVEEATITSNVAAMEVVEGDVKNDEMIVEVEAVKKRPRWMANKANFQRISKAEKIKRRNARFRKVLQPKNALMILNEMNGSTQYNFVELGSQDSALKSMKHPGGFKAVTLVEGTEYFGIGSDKATAKSNAAESAIKSLVLRKILCASTTAKKQVCSSLLDSSTDEGSTSAVDGVAAVAAVAPAADGNNGDVIDNDVVMSEDSKAPTEGLDGDMVPWVHIASFALHKLFNSWEETGTLLRASSQGNLADIASDTSSSSYNAGGNAGGNALVANTSASSTAGQLPQRALPENALSVHPVMLLNQMRPGTTQYNELDVIGTPPQIIYRYECIVDGKGGFIGKGPNKKIARRNAAYTACQNVLSLAYPEDILQDIVQSSEPRKLPPTLTKTMRFGKQQQQPHQGGGSGGYFVRQSQGGAAVGNNQDMGGGDGYNNAGVDPGYQWY